MFISLNVKLSSDCRVLSRDALRQCHTHRQGTPHPTVPAATTKPQQLWAATTQGRSRARDWGSSTPRCLEGQADSQHRGGAAHTAILFMFSALSDIGGQGGYRNTHTHLQNQSLQAKPVLCSFLVAQVAGLCFRGSRSLKQRWLCQASFRSGCPPARMALTMAEFITAAAQFLQQKSLLREIKTELTSARACAVIQREASANKSY